jgi:hypothetical protein
MPQSRSVKPPHQVAVNALNIRDSRAYISSFQRPVPRHLGIAINLTWKDGDPNAERDGQTATPALAGTAVQLMESAPFRKQYLSPIGVHDFQIQCIGSSSLEPIWNQCPHVAVEWMVNDMAIMVGFYDPDSDRSVLAAKAFGAAMIVLQECIAESGSVNPTTHSPLYLESTVADDYDEAIGSFYADGVGLWCEALVPLWSILMTKFRAYLTTIPEGGLLAIMDDADK